MKSTKIFSVIVLSLFLFSCATQKDSVAIAALKNAISAQNFTFEAKQVVPQDYRISQIFPTASNQIYQLNGGYFVKVTPDSLTVDLPFFGRAYQASMDPAKAGIKLATNQFDVKQTKGKKGSINVAIIPQNSNHVQQIFMTIGESGYATLGVVSFQRETINFYGTVK